MNPQIREAIRLLSGKLIFGNAEQIAAVILLSQLEECRDALTACPHGNPICKRCEGDGEIQCECERCGDSHYRGCPICDGSGKASKKDCDCLNSFPGWLVESARWIQKHGLPWGLPWPPVQKAA